MAALVYFIVAATILFIAALYPVLIADVFGLDPLWMLPYVAFMAWLCARHVVRVLTG